MGNALSNAVRITLSSTFLQRLYREVKRAMRSIYIKQTPPSGHGISLLPELASASANGGGDWVLYEGCTLQRTPALEAELPGPHGGKLLQVLQGSSLSRLAQEPELPKVCGCLRVQM